VSSRAQSVVAMELRQLIAESHVVDLFDRPRSQTIATRLFPREDPLVNHHDIKALFGEPVSGRGTRRSGANDQNVVVIVHGVMFMISSGLSGCGGGSTTASSDQPSVMISASAAVPRRGAVPTPSSGLSKVMDPSSRPKKISLSAAHHFSYSAA